MTVTHDLQRLSDLVADIERELTTESSSYDKTIKQGIIDAKDELAARVRDRGKGLRGPLSAKPYSDAYEKRKRIKTGGPLRVNFLLSGQLWASFTAEFERQGEKLKGFLFFKGGRNKGGSNAQVARGLHADRPFFDLLDDEKQIIENAVNDAIEEAFKLSDFD